MSDITKEELEKKLDLFYKDKVLRPKVENIVYTCKLNTYVSLSKVYTSLFHMGAQYNRKRFPAVVLRKLCPQVAILIFAKGKMVCTGAKSTDHARSFINDTIYSLRTIAKYYRIRLLEINIQNMVGALDLLNEFDLVYVRSQLHIICNYTPKNFPGAVLRFVEISPIAVLLFTSGKIVITGARCYDEVNKAFEFAFPILKKLIILKDMNCCLTQLDNEDHIFDLNEENGNFSDDTTSSSKDDHIASTSKYAQDGFLKDDLPLLSSDDFVSNKRKRKEELKISDDLKASFINELRKKIKTKNDEEKKENIVKKEEKDENVGDSRKQYIIKKKETISTRLDDMPLLPVHKPEDSFQNNSISFENNKEQNDMSFETVTYKEMDEESDDDNLFGSPMDSENSDE